ncbi:MAG: amidohydrolase [Flavobacteriales bacterium]|nr:amidohydrolase [Flavobacteriales bacterium]MDG1718928.1 amidohydrolase family protein [Flavobacteriales bacterium]|tara:strand:- start:4671 stop:5936 length:1266 start_codon:yes stop_codon:yes gene_type:complete
MNKKIFLLILNLFLLGNISAQKTTLIMGGIAHLGTGEKIENSLIVVRDGKFDLVADASVVRIDPSAFDTIIRAYGKHIYPAFIAPNTTLGITEIDAVRASKDYNEVGSYNPNVRSQIAYNTDSKIIKTVRTNGVLVTQTTPRGGVISGLSSVMYLDGWNWEDATLKADDGIHLNWPSSFITSGWWAEPGKTSKNKNYDDRVKEIKNYFEIAKSYSEYDSKMDLELVSIKELFKGTRNLYIHANYANDIRESVRFFKKIGIKNIVIVGGRDALNAVSILKENNISIILERVHSLPVNEDASIDQFYKLPSQLSENNILFCLSYSGDMEAMGTRNLPFTAGTAVAYGLDMEKAIASISLNTAIILGIEKTTGSIEIGKNATFFISSGDALDMRTNNIELSFIKGIPVDLNNHQKELFKKYKNR